MLHGRQRDVFSDFHLVYLSGALHSKTKIKELMFEATTLILQLIHLNVQRSFRSEPENSGVNRSVTRCFLIELLCDQRPFDLPGEVWLV